MAQELTELEIALSEQLAEEVRWYPRYGQRDCRWFSKRMIAYHRPAGGASYPVDSIRAPCLSSIQAATAQVAMKVACIAVNIPLGTRRERLDRPRINKQLAQIAYGAIQSQGTRRR
jgi:hypothetical protein